MKTTFMIQFVHRDSAVPGSVYQDFYNASRPAPYALIYIARRTMEGIRSGAVLRIVTPHDLVNSGAALRLRSRTGMAGSP